MPCAARASGVSQEAKTRGIFCPVTEGEDGMHVAACKPVSLVVGNRGVPHLMLPFPQ